MWRTHFNVNIDVALLVVIEVDIRMTLVWSHLRRVLLNVHGALHPITNQSGEAVAATVMPPNHVAPQIAEQAVVPFGVHWCVAYTRATLRTRFVFATERLSWAWSVHVQAHAKPHTTTKLLVTEMMGWQLREVEPGSTTAATRFPHTDNMLIGCTAFYLISDACNNL